jgi:hypothetical protein
MLEIRLEIIGLRDCGRASYAVDELVGEAQSGGLELWRAITSEEVKDLGVERSAGCKSLVLFT